jgi:hypothetical protein
MKLWNVNVSVEIDMPVVAETEEEAEEDDLSCESLLPTSEPSR